jgi:hypothetical protein
MRDPRGPIGPHLLSRIQIARSTELLCTDSSRSSKTFNGTICSPQMAEDFADSRDAGDGGEEMADF